MTAESQEAKKRVLRSLNVIVEAAGEQVGTGFCIGKGQVQLSFFTRLSPSWRKSLVPSLRYVKPLPPIASQA